MAYKDYDYGWQDNSPDFLKKKTTKSTKKTAKAASYKAASPVAVYQPVLPEEDREAIPLKAYDPDTDGVYRDTLAALEEIRSAAPEYAASYDGMLQGLYDTIANRDPFSYDLEGDTLYRQYRDQYMGLGRLAMEDTMGRAAGLTGGYGSSYGENAGQQAYGAYLQQLNDRIPELYGLALDRYNMEGKALYDRFGLVSDLADREFSVYRNAYQNWLTERNNAQSRADKAYERGHTAWKDENSLRSEQYDNLVKLISTSGYNPGDATLAAAGMTRAQANALLNEYLRSRK